MAHSIQRLTMYALISAIEIDLREFLTLHVIPVVGQADLLPSATLKKVINRFDKDNPGDLPEFEELLAYLDLAEEIAAIKTNDDKLDGLTRDYIKRFYFGFDSLSAIRNRVMHSRPLEYDDLFRVSDFATALVASHQSLWATVRTTRRALQRDYNFASTIIIPDTPDETARILHNLPQPEFDDTGFIGRQRELADLKQALHGSFPVVTVIGEGGLGKTALALKACYDLLDSNDSGFDAIVWTTAKTTKLTVNELEVIDGAITSSLGLIDNAASMLGRQSSSARDDLIMHLKYNKILLVIDNLETVIDHVVRDLAASVPTGSRILFTTRIGLGAFDFPVPLLPLNKTDSAVYFRSTARVWGIKDLANSPPEEVDAYCAKLQYNNLFIKWFIQSVRAGKPPAALTSNPTIFLQFCLQNVFNVLSLEAKKVATTLAGLGGSQTTASLAFFTDLDSLSIQGALSVLITANLVNTERSRSAENEDRYTISSLARMYIHQFIRPNPAEQRLLISKQNKLRAAQEEFTAKAGIDIFDINNIYIRSRDDYIVAKILTTAIECIFAKDLQRAHSEIEKANDLSPNYFEVHRVRALLQVAQEDFFAAAASYDAAISLAPNRAPLRLWYGGFLSRYFGDQEGALKQLVEAERLAPSSALAKLECARVLQYLRRFTEAGERLRNLPNAEKLSARTRRVHLDLLIQNEIRHADHLAGVGDGQDALECLERAKTIFEGAPSALIDHRTIRNLNRARSFFSALRRAFVGLPEFTRLAAWEAWLPPYNASPVASGPSKEEAPPAVEEADATPVVSSLGAPPNRGRLAQLHGSYGFVETGGARYFFHREHWTGESPFIASGEGAIVQFETQVDSKGTRAVNVRPVDETPNEDWRTKRYLGAIRFLGANHGFIKLDRGGDLFFARQQCAEGTRFSKLILGERVRCEIDIDAKRRPFGVHIELYSGL